MIDFVSPPHDSGLYLPKDAQAEARADTKEKAKAALDLVHELQVEYGTQFGDASTAAVLTFLFSRLA